MFNNIVPFFIALRYSKSKHANSFVAFINRFSVAGIALGLMALIAVVSIMNGFEAQLKQRVLGVVPHVVADQHPEVDYAQHNQVLAAMPYAQVEAIIQSSTSLRGVQIQGMESDLMTQYSVFANNMMFGRLDLQPGSFEVIIGRALALQLGISPGDNLRVLIAGKAMYTPFGRVPTQRLVRVVGVFDLGSQVDDSAILMHWQDVMRLKREKATVAPSYRLFLADAFAYPEVQDWLMAQGIESISWRHRQGPLFDAVKMEKNLMLTMLLLIIAVAAFNIVSALVMVATEKQADMAILQTQGMQPKSIMAIFLFNGVLNGIKGAIYGSLLGGLLIVGINPALDALGVSMALAADGSAVPIVVNWSQILLVIGLSIALCLLASVYPSYRAMRIQPAQVLHNS